MPLKDLDERKKYMKEYRLKNKEKTKEYNRQYYVKNIKENIETKPEKKNGDRQYVKTVGGKISDRIRGNILTKKEFSY